MRSIAGPLWGLGGLLLGLGLATAWPLTAQEAAPSAPLTATAPPALKQEIPAARGLDANLFIQISAEYRACCYQAYNLATSRLRERLAETKDDPRPKAIILDLDETVFDNAGFQAMMLRSGLAYDQRLWDWWEANCADQVGLIPGAKEFLLEADRLGVTPFYISNRNARYVTQGRKIIERHRLPLKSDGQLLFATTTSDKTARRAVVAKEHHVLLLLGDNLRDFDERFRSKVDAARIGADVSNAQLEAAIAARFAEVDETRDCFGSECIILPNPAYGEWNKVLGLGRRDFDRLAPTLR